MPAPLICLTLTCPTLRENAELCSRYAKYVDLAELRVDYLSEEEQLEVRKFPSLINMPCILTIRRVSDGGLFNSSEFSRTALFGRALAFADQNPSKNFAYVDFEEDFRVPSLEDASLAFGVKIIRSYHKLDGNVPHIRDKCLQMRKTGFEIPKIVFKPQTLSDLTRLFREAQNFNDFPHILCATGRLGLPSRILSHKIHSCITYTSPLETAANTDPIGLIEPMTLNEIYNFREISDDTDIFAITANPLRSNMPFLFHNAGFRSHGMNKVIIPLNSTSVSESLQFAEQAGISGLCISAPFNKDVMYNIEEIDTESSEIGSCNTIIRHSGHWTGYQTTSAAFQEALTEFIGFNKLHRRKIAIIGAGIASQSIAHAIKIMGGKACIFARNEQRGYELASKFGFLSAPLGSESVNILEKYSDIIIQTTNVGMNERGESNKENNPIWFYQFKGHEKVFDIIYSPERTPLLKSAFEAGCKVKNGVNMLKYQCYRQFKYLTGQDYESSVTSRTTK